MKKIGPIGKREEERRLTALRALARASEKAARHSRHVEMATAVAECERIKAEATKRATRIAKQQEKLW